MGLNTCQHAYVRYLLNCRGETYKSMAEELGISSQAVKNTFIGSDIVSIKTKDKIARHLEFESFANMLQRLPREILTV